MQLQRLSPCRASGLHRWRRPSAAWMKYASALGRCQTYGLIGLFAAAALLASACGGGENLPSGTEISERPERQPSAAAAEPAEPEVEPTEAAGQAETPQVDTQAQAGATEAAVEPEAQAEPVEQEVVQQEAAVEQEAAEREAATSEVEAESNDTITINDQLIEETVAALSALRTGLTVNRNSLGDPDAPVLIVEYGDFQ